MTEQQWLECHKVWAMLQYLERLQRWDRQVGFFIVACCRQVEHLIEAPDILKAVDAAERYVAGLIQTRTFRSWVVRALKVSVYGPGKPSVLVTEAGVAAQRALWYLSFTRYTYPPVRVVSILVTEARRRNNAKGRKQDLAAPIERRLCELLRDTVGNPFHPRPAHDAAWLEANGGLAGRLANSIYAERKFSELPILADALEDAGCTEAALLEHLRGPGPHERGCWALDVILGKG
jgi:hypothetical protein